MTKERIPSMGTPSFAPSNSRCLFHCLYRFAGAVHGSVHRQKRVTQQMYSPQFSTLSYTQTSVAVAACYSQGSQLTCSFVQA